MAVEIAQGSPLAIELTNVIQPKLTELGWSSGDDTGLAEYLVLMLGSGKTQDQIATELSTDFLNIDPTDPTVVAFSQWVFEQVEALQAASVQVNQPASLQSTEQPASSPSVQFDEAQNSLLETSMDQNDADMEGSGARDQGSEIPSGPKAMRVGSQRFPNRRMVGQMNQALDRSGNSALHHVRGGGGQGRIDTHSKHTPRGPTPKGPRAGNRAQQMQQGMMYAPPGGQMGGMPGQFGGPQMQIDPQQIMNFMSMMEQYSGFMSQGYQQSGPNPSANPTGAGKSLFERVEKRPNRNSRQPQHNGVHSQPDHNMETDEQAPPDPSSSMEVEDSSQPGNIEARVCRFNLSCTKPDCPFAHQSPVAPPGVSIDLNDTCAYGPACKNPKCVGKHPSPAQKTAHLAKVECMYYPLCSNPHCHFHHPDVPGCRNGGDCAVPDCKFAHCRIQCRHNPCLNPACGFKHVEGQRKGTYEDKVWTKEGGAQSGEEGGHVSDRKFVVDEDEPEDLIIPGQGDAVATEGFVE